MHVLYLHRQCLPTGRPLHWVTPSLGKVGKIGPSRHNFAVTVLLSDLSTPLDSFIFSVLTVPLEQKVVRWVGGIRKQNAMF